jgi:HAD superfamily phosphoserine phosphatase-like hydrolase
MVVALFDLDQTLFSCSVALEYYLYLIRAGFLKKATLIAFCEAYVRRCYFNLSIRELHEFIFDAILKQQCSSVFLEQLSPFLDIVFEKHLYYPAYERLQYARHMGYYTAIVTSSPDFIAKAVAKRLNVGRVFATQYSFDELGKFDKITQLVDGQEKARFVEALSLELKVALPLITAYSDSFHDIAFLESAGQKVAVKPDKKLKAYCQRHEWEII